MPIPFEISAAPMAGFFNSGATRPIEFRLQSLSRLEKLIRENQDAICEALYADLRKPRQEALIAEVAVTLEEIAIAKKNLRRWMKPKCARTPLVLRPARSRVYFEPVGVVLILGPWNYPFQLTFAPLVGALAAGNCAVVKPSELTVKTSQLIASLVAKYFPPEHVHVIEGGIPETTALLNQKFDHIFFTGSSAVGRVVMRAAAEHLTPVTLELGGKSPVIVCEDADLDLAARRIVWGKYYNAGQTCVAPDYLYVQESVEAELLEKIKRNIFEQFGENAQQSRSYSRVVNDRNFSRLTKLIAAGNVVYGGRADAKDLYIEPTVLSQVSWADPVMLEEIFGPVLPVLSYARLQEAFDAIRSKPKPLSAYLFTRSKRLQREFVEDLSFGGGCINDVVVHLSNPYLPFGGVGESGFGSYHGKYSFHTFSHPKSLMHRNGWLDFSARYAPYSEGKLRFLRRFFRF